MAPTALTAAVPWTYWLAYPLLAWAVLNVIGVLVVYYLKVIKPQHEREMLREEYSHAR
jgi:hypothetical protein